LYDPAWRKGSGLSATMNVAMIGAPKQVALFLQRHSSLAKISNWSALAMECAFPLALVVGQPLCLVFLGWGVMFHLTNAVVLGFNHFVWAWLATYPAVLYVASQF
jgi:hypothetical protein